VAVLAIANGDYSVNIVLDPADVSEDTYLTSLITAARQYCEEYQNRAYITQTWEMSLQYFLNYEIEVPKGKLQTIDSITYKNSAGIVATLAENTGYVYSTRGVVGRITPPYGKWYPTFTPFPLDAIIITFTCGYGDAVDVPERVKQAMKLLISHWYENRVIMSDTKVAQDVRFTLEALLWIDRIVVI
jgi:uncharacterized phiE125 gp8 family phage protein